METTDINMKKILKWFITPRGLWNIICVALIIFALSNDGLIYAVFLFTLDVYMNFGGTWAKSWKNKDRV